MISTWPTLNGARLVEACILLGWEQIPQALLEASGQGLIITLAQRAMELTIHVAVHVLPFCFDRYLGIHYINDSFKFFLPLQEKTG
jgi:hypothetical protein